MRGRCARVGLSIDNPRPATVPGVWGPVGYPPASILSGGSKRPPSTARLTPTTPSATDYRHCIDYRAQQPTHKPTNPAYPYKDRKLEREGRQAERTHPRPNSPPPIPTGLWPCRSSTLHWDGHRFDAALFGIRESANQISNPSVPRTSVRTKRTPGGVRPRRLDWHIDSPPVYAKAPTATTNHQQGRNGTKTVFPRTPPKEIAWFRYRLEPISLQILVQFVRTDF